MKQKIFTFLIVLGLMALAGNAAANNIPVSNTKLTGHNTTDSYVMVGFNHTQENCNRSPGNFNYRCTLLVIMENYVKSGVCRQDAKFSTSGLFAASVFMKQVGLVNRILASDNLTTPAAKTSLFKGIDVAI